MMRTLILILLMALTTQIAAAQHYTLHNATKGVTVETGGKSVKAVKGMRLKANDNVVIPKGGNAEILNTLDKCIYKSIGTGRISVSRLMVLARKSAGDKLAAVGAKMKLARGKAPSRKRVYSEKGMVYRSTGLSESEEADISIDPQMLAAYIQSRLDSLPGDTLPSGLLIEKIAGENDRFMVNIANGLDYPVYINSLRLLSDSVVGVSPLFQGVQNLRVDEKKSMTEELMPQPSGESVDFIIVTASPVDIINTVKALNETGTVTKSKPEADEQLPAYVRVL